MLSCIIKRIFVFRFLSICVILLFSLKQLYAQSISNEGTDFWLCFPSHLPAQDALTLQYRLANMSVFITSKSNSKVKVTCGNWSKSYNVQANKVLEVAVPRDDSYIINGSRIYTQKGIRVTVEDGQPKVVVYAHVFAGARSAASLVLPVEALSQKYYAISYKQSPIIDGFSQFNIIAVEAQTTVKITPVRNGIKSAVQLITLEKAGDVYQYQSPQDITGSLIEVDNASSACKKIAVFSGSTALLIQPENCILGTNGSADPLF